MLHPMGAMEGFSPIPEFPRLVLDVPILLLPVPAIVLYPVFIDMAELLELIPQVVPPLDMVDVWDESDNEPMLG